MIEKDKIFLKELIVLRECYFCNSNGLYETFNMDNSFACRLF